jgi:predicted RNA-binding Zn-ribbon protein involved in translation (DUF1610 family)
MAIQDDNIGGWQVLWGAKVQANAIGAIKSGWKNIPTTLVVDRFVRTTRACRCCGALVELGLEDRIFVCPHCGHTEDRDLHSSRAIAVLAINNQPQELRCLPVETTASTGMLAILQRIPGISASLVDETGSLALKGEVVHKTYPGIIWAPTVRPIDDISVELVFNSAPPNPLTVRITG